MFGLGEGWSLHRVRRRWDITEKLYCFVYSTSKMADPGFFAFLSVIHVFSSVIKEWKAKSAHSLILNSLDSVGWMSIFLCLHKTFVSSNHNINQEHNITIMTNVLHETNSSQEDY